MVLDSVRTWLRLGILGVLGLSSSHAIAKEYIVKLRTVDDVEATVANRAHRVLDRHDSGRLIKIELGSFRNVAEEAQALASWTGRPDVEYIVPNFTLQMLSTPNDPKFSEQWALSKVRAEVAWDHVTGSKSVLVAVIDTGVDLRHPDLMDNIFTNAAEIPGNHVDDDGNGLVDDIHGWDFLDNDADPSDSVSQQNPGHGTHCAGIVGAVGNNGRGTVGMSQTVAIVPLRFIGPTGQGDLMGAIKAIDYAIAIHADVISASWGAKVPASQAQPLVEAIERASNAGVTFVAAAANNGESNDLNPMYPANADVPNLIAVAASDPNDAKPQWSNFGRGKVALASPGLDIVSTLPNDSYGKLSGTSMATPLVAGLVALLKASHTGTDGANLSGASMKALLQSTGVKANIETACMCRIDAGAAATALVQKALVIVPTAATFKTGATGSFTAFGGAGGYRFASSNPSVVEVAADGTMSSKAAGETTVRVTDANGTSTESLAIRVVEGGGDAAECPLPDPQLCTMLCMIQPDLPWCQ